MAKLFVICGHGAGDPGAVGNGCTEAERVRALGKRIKELGGDSVMLGDTNRNYYKDNGIMSLNISKDYKIIELHMDSSAPSAKGGHVIIKKGFEADAYDIALANFINGIFPGRSEKIVHRNDLANVNRAAIKGYNYRLLECGFISNADDVNTFNSRLDEIAKGILACFGISSSDTSTVSKPNTVSKPTSKPTTNTTKKVSDTKMPTIKQGSQGKAVKIWQVIIGATADGIFGKKTATKTKEFQKNHGLDNDGIVGPKTWKAGLESV